MKITKNEIKKIVAELNNQEFQIAKYGNGNPCEFKRIIKDGAEFSLVDGFLYVGTVGATVTRIKEGRREDNLVINNERTNWATLIANNVKEGCTMFYTFAKPFEI